MEEEKKEEAIKRAMAAEFASFDSFTFESKW